MRVPRFILSALLLCGVVHSAEDAPSANSDAEQHVDPGLEKLLQQRITVDFMNADLHWLLSSISLLNGATIDADEKLLNGSMTIQIDGMPLRDFIVLVCKKNNLSFKLVGDHVELVDAPPHQAPAIPQPRRTTPANSTIYSLWDGEETIEHYAQRARLPSTKSLDLGGGVSLDLVLIPAGTFMMGASPPVAPTWIEAEDQFILTLGAAVLAALLVVILRRAVRARRRPSFSLRGLLLLTLAASVMVYGAVRQPQSRAAWTEFNAASARAVAVPADTKPAHAVTLTAPFYMGKYVVTQKQYRQIVPVNPSSQLGDDLPVDTISWVDAQRFGQLLSQKCNATIELPTEAQWEFACRAGTRTRFYTGDSSADLDAAGWRYSPTCRVVQPVGKKRPNAFGLYDMHGNIFEWCQDWYDEAYYTAAPITNPNGPETGSDRVMRGGCAKYNFVLDGYRSDHRFHNDPDFRDSTTGFRIVMPVD